MEKLGHYLSLLTMAFLNAIVFFTAISNSQIVWHSANFNVLVNCMYLTLLCSSLIVGYVNWQIKRKIWALLFWANIFIVLIPTVLSYAKFLAMPHAMLIFLDLYWLNQYWWYASTHRMRGHQ
jgi:hypothetical protein